MTTNTAETQIEILAWVEPLQRMERLTGLLRALGAELEELREAREAELAALRASLPPALLSMLRGRIRCGQRLVSPARRGQCSACYTRIPRGDYPAVLAGRSVVCCQYCQVLLFADEIELGCAGAHRH